MPFKIAGKLSLDGTSFKAGIAKAKASVQGLGAKMKSAMASPMAKMAGAMAVAMIGAQVKKTIDWGTRLRDLGVSFGVSTEWLQKMEYAATQTGGTLDTMMKSYKKMLILKGKIENKMTTEVSREMYADYFATLGISLQQLKTLNGPELFEQIARNVKNMNMGLAKNQEAFAMVYGKSSIELINMMRVGVQGLGDDYEKMGVQIPSETIERLGAQGDKMEEMSLRWRSGWADALGWFFNTWDELLAGIAAWTDTISDAWGSMSNLLPVDALKLLMGYKDVRGTEGGTISERQQEYLRQFRAERNADKAARDALLQAKAAVADPDDGAAAAKSAKEIEASKKRSADLERRQAGWRGFGATSLEKIGGSLGMKTTQLNVAQQHLALAVKAEEGRKVLAGNVQAIKNTVSN
jgi:hypothetical protein